MEQLTYTAAGGAVVAGAIYFYTAIMRRFGKRVEIENNADDRAMGLVRLSSDIADKLRLENARLQEELFRSSERYAKLAETMQATIERVHAENREAIQHIHKRLDESEKRHDDCLREHQQCREDIAELRKALQVSP